MTIAVYEEISPSTQLTQMLFGFMSSQAIVVAAKFGIADLLKDRPKSAEQLAQATGLHPRALYRLMRALASVGIFAEDDDRRFRLTPLAEPLRRDAPGNLRDFIIFMGADFHWEVWGNLAYSVQTGKPAFEHIHGKPVFDYLPEHPDHAQIFNDAMTSFSAAASEPIVNAYNFSEIAKIVDVGGGHGFLLATILRKYPQMQGVLYDAPHVIAGAQELIEVQGVSDRCEMVSGDFFASVPEGGDAYIMKHIIHDWEDEKAIRILRNCYRVMNAGGRVLVVEMVIPEGNAPSPGKFLDLEMLLFLHSHERTEAEYRALYEQAGFKLTRIVPTQSPYSVIEGVRV
ncbi:MAG TPA: methyltransferase [Blastocatellia bacterium]|nr:methyltransferase [Blastocatellia bacterium]